MELSVVSTIYNSKKTIKEFVQRTENAIKETGINAYEIVVVNDGSPDNSLAKAKEIMATNNRIKIIDLTRNFGHHKAMMTGLEHAEGELVFLIDSDLEESPKWLIEFRHVMMDEGADVVFGIQERRRGNKFEQLTGEINYRAINWLSNCNHPKNITTARLMTQRYVKSLLQFRERDFIISQLWLLTGYRQVAVKVEKLNTSPTTYGLKKRVQLFINIIVSFSNYPLRIAFWVGLFIMSASLTGAAIVGIQTIFSNQRISGWASIILSLWLIGGFLSFFLGIISLYISEIYTEVKKRPTTLVREIYQNRDTNKSPG